MSILLGSWADHVYSHGMALSLAHVHCRISEPSSELVCRGNLLGVDCLGGLKAAVHLRSRMHKVATREHSRHMCLNWY